jgi:4-amino-4-deoxy-L-arabinose transferase-like glycosyltransferase
MTRDRWATAVLAALCLPVLFYRLGSYGIVNGDEAFYHYVARNMVETGDWTRLEFTGEHRIYDTFLNAPLQYWARAALIAAFGDSYWTMRVLSTSFALLTVLATRALARSLSGPRAGLLAGLIQLTTFQFVFLHGARTGEIEPFVCFALTLSALLFLRSVERGRSFLPHHLCWLVLMNLKLPLLAVPIAAELAYLCTTPSARSRARDWLGWAAILPLGLLWHVAQFVLDPEASRGVLELMRLRATGDAGIGAGLLSRAGRYGWASLYGAYPYVVAYPLAVGALLVGRTRPFGDERFRLVIAYALSVWGFFLLVAQSFPWYIIPAYPFLSVCLGSWLAALERSRGGASISLAIGLVVSALIWIEVEPLQPFAGETLWTAPLVRLRGGPGTSSWPAWLATFAAAVLALEGARGLAPAWLARAPRHGLGWLLIGLGALRVLPPLAQTSHVSPMESLKLQLDAERAAGRTMPFPIRVPGRGSLLIRYFFADDFDVGVLPTRPRVYVLLREGRTREFPKEQ